MGKRRFVSSLAALALAALSFACGQEPPLDRPPLAPYHPLADGAWWDYQHADWVERVTLTATDLDGESAFVMTDSPNPKDKVRSDAALVERDGRVLRVFKQEYLVEPNAAAVLKSSVAYGVGFTRFDENWAQQAVGFKETPEYERVETPAGGAAKLPEARRHSFEILSLSEQVSTPVGNFDCIKIRRTKDWQAEEEGVDASDAQPKVFWFARGVGKVRELNLDSGKGELLTNYFLPDPGSTPP
jgi:hypothetical protein